MYENLAAKYRPMTLSDLIGQEAVKTTLVNAVKLNRVAHSYVFYGPRGCGKTTVARILAKTLNCQNPDKNGNPCGRCASWVEIAGSKSLDVIEIDAASNTAVDNVRSVIVDQVNFAPSRDKYKIYILDEVHMLSKGSFNALLKTLEEPPSHVVFIMATTEQEKVPPTILSRSQCFRFRFIPEDDITARLKYVAAQEKISVDSESLRLITRSCGGAMRDALTLLDRAASFCGNDIKVSVLNELLGRPGAELLQLLAISLISRDATSLHNAFDRIASEGYDVLSTLRELRNLMSEAFFAKMGYSAESEPVRGLPSNVTPSQLARLARKLTVLIKEIQYSDAMAVAAEVGLFTLIEVPQDITSLVIRLEELEKKIEAGGASYDSSSAGQTLISGGSYGTAKKKDELSHCDGHNTAHGNPVPELPEHAADMSPQPSQGPAVLNSATFADAWRRTLGRISVERPMVYNELASCRIRHDAAGTVTLVAQNLFYANRVSYALADVSAIMQEITGRKIDFIVTSGPDAAKNSSAVSVPDLLPENRQVSEAEPSSVAISNTASDVNIVRSSGNNAGTDGSDDSGYDEEPLPEEGEAAEITEIEEAPPEPEQKKQTAHKKNSAAEKSIRKETPPVLKKTAAGDLKTVHVAESNEVRTEKISGADKGRTSATGMDNRPAGTGSPARHQAARLEFVPPEEVPADFTLLREVFGQSITRVNRVL
ncbi:MAG: DNA polymerase III subunit gamma/tau [Elusimicrobiales bacterium]|nr:DNA polymerase III subunit gamma/tau [Elusimicrobiales bacterium]